MKLLGIVLLSLFLQVRCGTLAKLESRENETEADQQRSVRVHRVADHAFLSNDDSRAKNMIWQMVLFGHEELGKLLVHFPNLSNLVQHEMQLFKELNTILKDLVLDGTITLKSMDVAISEMTNATSPTPVKPKTDNSLENLLEEELNIQQDSQENDSRPSTSPMNSMDEVHSKAANVMKTLDHVLQGIQSHVTFVRNVFGRLCRKHRSPLPTRSSYGHREKFVPTSQPKKVSIL